MSSPIQTYFENSLLSWASYADLAENMTTDRYITELKEVGFADSRATQFVATFSIVSVSSPNLNGFSAVLFQKNDGSNDRFLAIRGTNDPFDAFTDLVDIGLLGSTDIQAQYASLEAFYIQLQDELKLTPAHMLTVTGHSSGGFLAQTFTADHAEVAWTYTYNAPGIGGSVLQVLELLGVTPATLNFPNITNVVGQSPSLISGFGTYLGTVQPAFIESSLLNPIHNHRITTLTDALALYDLMARIDPTVSVQTVTKILNAVAATAGSSLENGLDAFRKLFQGSTVMATPVGDPEAYYTNLLALRNALPPGRNHIDSLVGIQSSTVLSQAKADTLDGLAYRYALKELNPFVLLGVDYQTLHNAGGGLDLYDAQTGHGTWTALALQDRAELLASKNQVNVNDGELFSGLSADTHFADIPTGFEIGTTLATANDVIFGDDRIGDVISGRGGDDHLYGGDGADTIEGNGGRDYIEGNAGNDPLLSGGDGNDIILGQQGNDRLDGGADSDRLNGGLGDDRLDGGAGVDQYTYFTGQGQDRIVDSDRFGSIAFDGQALTGGLRLAGDPTDIYTSSDGHFTYVRSGNNLIVNNALTIENFDFANGMLGIYLADGAGTPAGQAPAPSYDRTISGSPADEFVNDGLTNMSNDQLLGGAGRDVVQAGGGEDALYGGDGDDLLIDALYGAGEDDFLDGGEGHDYLLGGVGDEILLGGGGDDFLFGSSYGSQPDPDGQDYLDGGSGNDYLWGGAAGDTLIGGADQDILRGDNLPGDIPTASFTESGYVLNPSPNPSAIVMSAAGRSDFLDGGAGDDLLQGDAGDDILIGGLGADRLYGDNQDEFVINEGDDFLAGGDGDDQLFAAGGNDSLSGDAGVDQLYGDQGDDILDGGDGADTMVGGDGADVLFGGTGNDRLFGEGLNNPLEASNAGAADFLDGGEGDDELQGGMGDDSLFGGSGADLLFGQEGHDSLFGDEGNDELQGGMGQDVLQGDAGNDSLFGQEGHDMLSGDDGNDFLNGGLGNDELDGGAGADQLVGDAGVDVLYGQAGNDVLFGDGQVVTTDVGADILDGGDGHDLLQGGGGDDQLKGGAGDDQLYGEVSADSSTAAGNDELHGGAGRDSLIGGRGNDRYIFKIGDGFDTVVDAAGEGNRVVFGEGITADSIRLSTGSFDSLVLHIGDSEDALSILGFGVNSPAASHPIEAFEFADGTTLTYIELFPRGFDYRGGAGSDVFVGTTFADLMSGGGGNDSLSSGANDDVLIGGTGDDALFGGSGDDTYFYNLGDGVDTIVDEATPLEENRLVLGAGITTEVLTTLLLRDGNAGDAIRLQPFARDDVAGAHPIEIFQFADGTMLSYEQLVSRGFDYQGNAADEDVAGTNLGDRLAGGRGSDVLRGGGGNDTYFFNLGDGIDTIIDSASTDEGNKVVFGAGLSQASARLSLENGTLFLRLNATGDAVGIGTFDSENLYGSHSVDRFHFTDGTMLTWSQIVDRGVEVVGTTSDDWLFGTNLDDRVLGRTGDDLLQGGAGHDSYVFNVGDGLDVIQDTASSNEGNEVVFGSGITAGQIELMLAPDRFDGSANDLLVRVNGNGDALQLDTFDSDNVSGPRTVEAFRFADNSALSYDQLVARGFDIIGTAADDQLGGTNTIDRLDGGEGNDVLRGEGGDDTLDGGIGNDRLLGGMGDDTYVFGSGVGQDAILESRGNLDTIRIGEGVAPGDVQGSREGNDLILMLPITGDSLRVQEFYLTPAFQVEQVIFADGTVWDQARLLLSTQRQIQGTAGIDVLTGDISDDSITGLAGNDQLLGFAGEDFLDGGSGADTIEGGPGDDTYVVDDPDDVVTERHNEGIDIIGSSVSRSLESHIENLTLTGTAAINGTGNELNNVLTGNSAANVLEGGLGDDTYVVGAGDAVVEQANEGIDTVITEQSYTLGTHIENLTLTGTAAVDATGNGLDNILVGNGAANVLTGGDGNDIYVVGAGDTVVEASGGGRDTVITDHSYTLGANLENVTLAGNQSINGTGNELDNVLQGNSSVNVLKGGLGDDTYVIGVGDLVVESAGEGIDTVQAAESYTLGANVENLAFLDVGPVLAANVTAGTGGSAHGGLSAKLTGIGNDLDNVLVGNRADNVLNGHGGDDWLDGRGGNDTLRGGEGGDTYLFGLGSGHDRIEDHSLSGEIDMIRFAPGLLPNQIGAVQQGNDLVLRMPGSRDSLTLANFFGSPSSAKKAVEFEDGTVWDETTLRTLGADPGPGMFFTDSGGSQEDNVFSGTVGNDEIRGTGGNDIIAGGAGHDILRDNAGNNVLDGGSGDDALFGGGGNDTFVFGRGYGHDTVLVDQIFFSGSLGFTWSDLLTTDTDTIQMVGLQASDVEIQRQSSSGQLSFTVTVLDTADQLTVRFRNGIYGFAPAPVTLDFADGTRMELGLFSAFPEAPLPAVFSSVDYTLSGTQENLVLLDLRSSVIPDPRIGTGNALDNVIVGNTADNMLDGGIGNDVLVGGFARSVEGFLFIDTGSDILLGGEGDDLLMPFGDETFAVDFGIGGDSNPFNTPDDVLLGGPGHDGYVIRHAGQIVGELEDEGIDTVLSTVSYTLPDHIENLTFIATGDEEGGHPARIGTGNSLDNVLIGGGGADILIGVDGDDTLYGGNGDLGIDIDDDGILDIVSVNDVLIGGTGHDTYVFNLGDGIDTIEDTAITGAGNRIQFGEGITRNDLTFREDPATRSLTVAVGTGGDAIRLTNFDVTGANGTFVVEALAFADGTGANLASFFGPSITEGDDLIATGAGNDVIDALAGDDTVDTGAGNDTITGGMGNDRLMGGAGHDTYVFNLGDGVDTITDATASGEGNELQFGASITLNDLSLGVGSLLIHVGDNGDAIHLTDFDPANVLGPRTIETFRFADGTVLSYEQLIQRGFDVAGTAASDTIMGTNVVDRISGLAGNDTLVSGAGNDDLDGGIGDDLLDGGAGADTMAGGIGGDTYVVADAGDVVTESTGEGNDTVESGINYTLPSNVENIVLTGSANLNGTGNGLNNVLTGNNAHNVLDGLDGADTMGGGEGDDLYVVDHSGDVVIEQLDEGMDSIQSVVTYTLAANVEHLTLTGMDAINGTGNVLDNMLTGNEAANILDGGAGNDVLVGGAANDMLFGGAGNDTLDGGSGADAMIGDAGDDTYLVDSSSDRMTEAANEGTDTVESAVTYTLGANLENLTLTGGAALNGTGNALDNILFGNSADNTLTGAAGDDRLDGGLGNDTMIGGAGDDSYVVNQDGDVVKESFNQGMDTIESSVTYVLRSNVENLALTGLASISGTGNSLNNALRGNGASNILDGRSGNDMINGGDGDDWLFGGSGHDAMLGAAGNDTLAAGSGNDALDGGEGTDSLDAGSGKDILSGGLGNDHLMGGSGNDLYRFNRADGQDVILDASGTADRLLFGADINPLDLVISRQADDLRLAVHGTSDQVTIEDWYANRFNRVESLQMENGQELANTKVDQLLQAMAAFTQQSGLTWDQAIDQRPQDVQSILAASWQ